MRYGLIKAKKLLPEEPTLFLKTHLTNSKDMVEIQQPQEMVEVLTIEEPQDKVSHITSPTSHESNQNP